MQGRHTVEVTIPAGVDDDVTLRLTGEGEPGPRGGPSGDLYLGFRVKPHPNLVRRGQDLLYELPISVTQAVLGDTIAITTVDGEHPVEVPAGTQPGRQLKMHGLGVPHVRTGRRGDLICVVRVVVPTPPLASGPCAVRATRRPRRQARRGQEGLLRLAARRVPGLSLRVRTGDVYRVAGAGTNTVSREHATTAESRYRRTQQWQ